MKELKDIDGRTINVGDRVAYPGRRGSSLWMSKATVLEILEGMDWRDRPFIAVKVKREPKDAKRYSWQGPPRLIVTLTNTHLLIKL